MKTFNNADQITGAIQFAIETQWRERYVKEKLPTFKVAEIKPGCYLVKFGWLAEVKDDVLTFEEDEFSLTENDDAGSLMHYVDSVHDRFHERELIVHSHVLTENI